MVYATVYKPGVYSLHFSIVNYKPEIYIKVVMNTFSAIETDYIRHYDRTVDTILIKNEQGKEKVVFVYNYEGYHYRVFENVLELMRFFYESDYKLLAEYSTEHGLDNFLARIDLNLY